MSGVGINTLNRWVYHFEQGAHEVGRERGRVSKVFARRVECAGGLPRVHYGVMRDG